MKVCILVLNYNGADLMRKYLPSFQKAAAASRYPCRVGVIDNSSTDGSREILNQEFPDVEVYAMKTNRVLCSYNDVAAKLDEGVLLFMNNDIHADENFVDPLVRPFLENDDVFFVTSKCFGATGKYEGNRTRAFIRYGIFGSSAIFPGHEKKIDEAGATFQGGFGAFDRKKFLELGGYDDLYLPGRLEDADICFRAQKRGWKCLYEPASAVYHEGGVSFKRLFGERRMRVIDWRNTFLFMWKNFSEPIIFFRFFAWFPVRALHAFLTLRTEFLEGFFRALPRLGEVLRKRRGSRKGWSVRAPSDREILGRV